MTNEQGKSDDALSETAQAGLAIIADLAIPAPLQKGFFKAVSRLTGALIDIPAAKLESYAEDIRAATEARKALTLKAAVALANEFQDNPELAARAQARATSKILREQVNVEDILKKTAEELSRSATEAEPADNISEDWWNEFENEAASKSSEEMKTVFGKLLSGEIQRPGTYSIRSIRSIGEMDRSTANLFRRFCSLSISVSIDSRVVSVAGNAGTNGLAEHGLPFGSLQVLEQHGLVNSDFNNWMDYGTFAQAGVIIDYLRKPHRLIFNNEGQSSLKLHGVSLTKIGTELRNIVDMSEDKAYTDALIAYLGTQGFSFSRLG